MNDNPPRETPPISQISAAEKRMAEQWMAEQDRAQIERNRKTLAKLCTPKPNPNEPLTPVGKRIKEALDYIYEETPSTKPNPLKGLPVRRHNDNEII